MANQNLSQFTEKLFVADADHTFIWDSAASISKRVSRNSWLSGTTADFHLGLADAASPVAQTISVQSVVAGTTNTAGANLSINGSQGTGTGAGGALLLRTAPAGSSGTAQNALVTAVAITSAGNVGIGTTAPGAKLQVGTHTGTVPSGSLVVVAGASPRLSFSSNDESLNYGAYILSSYAGGSYVSFGTRDASVDATALTLKGGNVGIGTTSPTSKLHVAETWNNAGTAFCAIKSVITDTNSAAGSDFLELYSGTSTQPLRFDVQKTGQMNIYGAWTDTSNYERLSFSAPSAANAVIGTNKAGTGTARGLDLQTDGVTRMTLSASSHIIQVNSACELLTVSGTGAKFDFSYNGLQCSNISGLGVSWANNANASSSKHVGLFAYSTELGVVQVNNSTKDTFRDLRCRSVIQQLPITTTITPASNGDLVVEATSNSLLTFKLKGSDGTVRSGTIALA